MNNVLVKNDPHSNLLLSPAYINFGQASLHLDLDEIAIFEKALNADERGKIYNRDGTVYERNHEFKNSFRQHHSVHR